MQNQKLRARAGRDRVGAALIVAEFHENVRGIERFHDRSNLPTLQALGRPIGQQSYRVERGRLLAVSISLGRHHSTQQVTNRGESSPVRTIQIVLTMAFRPCRDTRTSSLKRAPNWSVAICSPSPPLAPSRRTCRSQ